MAAGTKLGKLVHLAIVDVFAVAGGDATITP
jgi:hypothetical protein